MDRRFHSWFGMPFRQFLAYDPGKNREKGERWAVEYLEILEKMALISTILYSNYDIPGGGHANFRTANPVIASQIWRELAEAGGLIGVGAGKRASHDEQ